MLLGNGLLVEDGDSGERAYVASGSPSDPEVRALMRSKRRVAGAEFGGHGDGAWLSAQKFRREMRHNEAGGLTIGWLGNLSAVCSRLDIANMKL
jgi:hypothetical protein